MKFEDAYKIQLAKTESMISNLNDDRTALEKIYTRHKNDSKSALVHFNECNQALDSEIEILK